jgi:hypothetical protein
LKFEDYETYNKGSIGKHLSDNNPVQNSLKQYALSPVLFNLALEYDAWKARENHVGLKLNGTHHHPAYVDNVNLLG